MVLRVVVVKLRGRQEKEERGEGSESYYLCRGLQGNGRVPLVVLE